MRASSSLGATLLGGGSCRFRVWAPSARRVEVHILGRRERLIDLDAGSNGYHEMIVRGVEPGTQYLYRLDGSEERPDPASRLQPQGVQGPSAVVSDDFAWTDDGWKGLPLGRYVIYEIHVGTFSRQGTFDGVTEHLEELAELGVTALELMPVAQFPGFRNWGYDGVYPFAVQNTYGGPEGLKRLVDACHARGLALILDVVYNHLGPEGNCVGYFGPYFSERYRGPWGPPLNFDGPASDEVRNFFFHHALYLVRDLHIDALRLDAIHGILDFSARPFLLELGEVVHGFARERGRHIYLIAENDLNDARVVRPLEEGGYGLDGQWNDDFHHALHALLTGEREGYYRDFGEVDQLVSALRDGYVYSGPCSGNDRRRHDDSPRGVSAEKFIIFAQNHDQVGNRMRGDRLSRIVTFEQLKVAAAAVILSPYVPLLFMGEEFGETAPFAYFVSHSEEAVIEAVRSGRREQFASFAWAGEPPDPQEEETFERAKIDHVLRRRRQNGTLREFYRELVALRRRLPPPEHGRTGEIEVGRVDGERVIWLWRPGESEAIVLVINFNQAAVACELPLPPGRWQKLVDSAERRWGGPGSSVPSFLEAAAGRDIALPPCACILLGGQVERGERGHISRPSLQRLGGWKRPGGGGWRSPEVGAGATEFSSWPREATQSLQQPARENSVQRAAPGRCLQEGVMFDGENRPSRANL